MAERRRVAVIGGGVAGLTAIKSCLEEGLQPVCFEQNDDIGGLWYYSDEVRPNQGASSYWSMSMNVCKEVAVFSDFPAPEDCPQFMRHRRGHEYLHAYAKHFSLLPHIQLNRVVTKVKPTPDHHTTGQWEVYVKSCDDDIVECHLFDAVCLCSGALQKAFIPDLPGLQDFQGFVMHSLHYRRPEAFNDKVVFVIGAQFSGVDLASDIANHANQVYLSVGDGTHIIPLVESLPPGWYRTMRRKRRGEMFSQIARQHFDHKHFGIGDGGNSLLDGHQALSDDIVTCLKTGAVRVVPRVSHFTENSVFYVDGSSHKIDAILLATGYKPSFSYVECEDISGEDPMGYMLYKHTFPVSRKHPTLAVISVTPVYSPYFLLAEIVSRWSARVFAGKCHLPDEAKMRAHLNEKRSYYHQFCGGKIKEGPIEYIDVIAEEIGVQPYESRIFLKSPLLAYKMYYGPIIPAHYRLLGPGAWPDAWLISHDYYSQLYPDDIPRKLRLLAMSISGVILAGLVYHHYRAEVVSLWQKVASMLQPF